MKKLTLLDISTTLTIAMKSFSVKLYCLIPSILLLRPGQLTPFGISISNYDAHNQSVPLKVIQSRCNTVKIKRRTPSSSIVHYAKTALAQVSC